MPSSSKGKAPKRHRKPHAAVLPHREHYFYSIFECMFAVTLLSRSPPSILQKIDLF